MDTFEAVRLFVYSYFNGRKRCKLCLFNFHFDIIGNQVTAFISDFKLSRCSMAVTLLVFQINRVTRCTFPIDPAKPKARQTTFIRLRFVHPWI